MLAEARTWRDDVRAAVKHGTMRAASRTSLSEAARTLIAGMEAGIILDKSGRPYKPSTTRSYTRVLRTHVLPDLGAKTLQDIRRADLQDLVDRWRALGAQPSTARNRLDPVRVIYRRAVHRDEVAIDPTIGLALPAGTGSRERIASRAEASALIEALPLAERALWATALYAGLRRGELRALAWSCVDFDAGVIRVEWGWDDVEGRIRVKTDAGRRRIPLVGSLRKLLLAHQLATGRRGDDLVFGRSATDPFVPSTMRNRARKAWKEAGLEMLTPHEGRHCCASYFAAAGLTPKEAQTAMGHADIRVTLNVYARALPGWESGAAAKLDTFLDATTKEATA